MHNINKGREKGGMEGGKGGESEREREREVYMCTGYLPIRVPLLLGYRWWICHTTKLV